MHTEKRERDERPNGFYEWVQALVCTVLLIVLTFTFAARVMRVDGPSMRETLQNNDLMLVRGMLGGTYRAGEIVIVRKAGFNDGRPIVKRVIATAGQTVEIDFDAGAVFVDGEKLTEPYVRELTHLEEGTEFPYTVPEGCIFVMGDNRNDSDDSRDPALGAVDLRCVIGRVECLVFPGVSADSGTRRFSRLGRIS
ncbi:MAG: signal peptidase I [Oscillibacter sp.]|jgi:signal peptidase I|nr:signal peptidase I [Oscillibacter sp.]